MLPVEAVEAGDGGGEGEGALARTPCPCRDEGGAVRLTTCRGDERRSGSPWNGETEEPYGDVELDWGGV